MSFSFRDIYQPQLSPKRKTYEKIKNITDLQDVASTNTSYQALLEAQKKQDFDIKACQERQVVNQKKINELLPTKQLLESSIANQNTAIDALKATLTNQNVTMTGLETAGIITMVGSTASLTGGAAGLLPVTVNAVTFNTTTDVTNYINTVNSNVTDLIQKKNDVVGHYANYTQLKNSLDPYQILLGYQKTNYTGSNIANFAQVTGFSTLPQNLTQLDSYDTTNNQPPLGGDQGQLQNINAKIASLQEDCNNIVSISQKRLEELELLTITSLIKDQEKSTGKKSKANPITIALKYRTLKSLNPKTNILEVVDTEFKNNSALFKLDNNVSNLGAKVNTFTKAVEGKPGAAQQIKEQLNQYGFFDPAVCGLLALDTNGSILSVNNYHIPFQHVDVAQIKVQKTANYQDSNPIGRYEPVTMYGSSSAMQITIPLQYIAFESGYNSDEGFIQEMKDRFLAATFPIYGNFQRAGVRTYGAPHKYVLNMFEKFVNVPVIITDVSFEDQGGTDIYTWLSMGFKINLTLKTSYRVAQVISGDEVVNKGVRALSHRSNL